MDDHCRLVLQIGQLLGCCSCKATPSTGCYGTQRKCRSSRIGGGVLLRPSAAVTGPLLTTSCSIKLKSDPKDLTLVEKNFKSGVRCTLLISATLDFAVRFEKCYEYE
jgi:hypothetical protein